MQRFRNQCLKYSRYLFLLSVGIFSVLSMLVTTSQGTLAATLSLEPSVAIAVDITQEANCVETTINGVGTPQQSTIQSPCLPGTIMKNQTVPLSTAQAQGKKYVMLPSSNSNLSLDEKKSLDQQIRDLIENETQTIHSQAVHSQVQAPSDCFVDAQKMDTWTADGETMQSTVAYQRDPLHSCQMIRVGDVTVAHLSARIVLWWDHVQYSGFSMGTMCPQVPVGGSTSNFFGGIFAPIGLFFQNWVKDNACIFGSGTFFNDNLLLN